MSDLKDKERYISFLSEILSVVYEINVCYGYGRIHDMLEESQKIVGIIKEFSKFLGIDIEKEVSARSRWVENGN